MYGCESWTIKKVKVKVTQSCLTLCDPIDSATPWTVACQVLLSMEFSRQEYWSRLPCPFPGDLPDPGIKPVSLKSPALAREFFTTSTTWEAPVWNSPGKNPGVSCHSLLQGIFPTQGLKLGLLHFKHILYCLSHQGSQTQHLSQRQYWFSLSQDSVSTSLK